MLPQSPSRLGANFCGKFPVLFGHEQTRYELISFRIRSEVSLFTTKQTFAKDISYGSIVDIG